MLIFLEASQLPEACKPGVPLEFSNVKVFAVPNNKVFDLINWTADTRTYYLSASNGELTSSDGKIY